MALADAVLDLPGLCPAAASLAALAVERGVSVAVRADPAVLLYLARQNICFNSFDFPAQSLNDAFLLTSLELVEHGRHPFVDWRKPGADRVWRTCQITASIAEAIGREVGVSETHAFAGGLLAGIGWMGICAAAPDRVPAFLDAVDHREPNWQTSAWGLDHAALARRLVRCWRLPTWLADVIGHLDWDVNLVARLGADARLVAVVQLAVLTTQQTGCGLGLVVGATAADLRHRLRLSEEKVASLASQTKIPDAIPPLECASSQPLLADVLRLTLNNRRRSESQWIEHLNRDIDRLQSALSQQIADEDRRLTKQKLASLAEFAGGAGHEINNPLAVISGQAQYILKQMQWAEELLLEDPTPAAMLEAIKAKLTKPLQIIVGQSQKIHHVITDLMQFARPPAPRPTVVPVAKLVAEAVAAVRVMAEERRVRIVCPEVPGQLAVSVDAGQIRLALSNLLRNALEAAPAEGWASLRVQREPDGDLAFVIDDNGPGLAELHAEHLFDPFYSGRAAGRGRGLGLSTAWRLARQHGGDVRIDKNAQAVTRFLLVLPATDVIDNHVPATNGKREAIGYQFTGIG